MQIELAADMQQALALVPVAALATELSTAFEKANEQYYQQRQQQQTVTELLKREDAVRRRVAELEKIEREVTQLSKSNELLPSKRGGQETDRKLTEPGF